MQNSGFIYFKFFVYCCRAVNPPCLQILRIDRERMIEEKILVDSDRCKYSIKQFIIIIKPHYGFYYNGMPEFIRNVPCYNYSKITSNNAKTFRVGKSNLQEMANFGDRYGP